MRKYFTKDFALHLVDNWKLMTFAIVLMASWFSYLNWGLY